MFYIIIDQCISFFLVKTKLIINPVVTLERLGTMTHCFNFQLIFNFFPDIRLD